MSLVFLKGINVGKGKRIDSKELARRVTDALGVEFRSLLASGNLLSKIDVDQDRLRKEVSNILAEQDFSVDLIVFDNDSFLKIVEAVCKFSTNDPAKSLVYFTNDRVNPRGLEALERIRSQEEFELVENSFYIDYKEGVSFSKIDTKAIDKAFGVRSTGRNMNTVLKLKALL